MTATNANVFETSLVILALYYAAYRDVATRTIPDAVSICIAISGFAFRTSVGLPAVGVSIIVSVVLFFVFTFAHARGMLGGGDVKLMTAVACGLAPLELYHFILATAVIGGFLAGIHLLLRHLTRHDGTRKPPRRGAPGFRRIFAAERWRISHRGPLPYAVAIACGGLAAIGPRLTW